MRSRLLLVITAIAILAGAAAVWRRGLVRETTDSESTAQGTGGPRRGGEIVGSVRSEPRTFNRAVNRDPVTDVVAFLTQGKLARLNRLTFELEPRLAERWESSADGLTHTLHLRRGLTWSDGTPFTSADVVFTFDAAYDANSGSILGSALHVGGKPIAAAAPDESTVVLTYPEPFGPGLRILDNLWVLPKHKLEPALKAGTFAKAWGTASPVSDMAGMGPFTVREYQPGQRLVFERNSRYWRKDDDGGALPYLDRIVLEIVPDQNAEILRLTSGNIDMTQSELRPDDYAPVKRASDGGRLRLLDLGIGTDADAFWFCLNPEAWKGKPSFAFVQRPEFRRAISHAINREHFADTVYLGAAVPVWGPITPRNEAWFSRDVPTYPYDIARAAELLRGLGLQDRNRNGTVEDAKGTEARFSVMVMRGNTAWERGAAAVRDQLAKVGITLDVVPLELGAMISQMLKSQYEAIYYRPMATDLDPAANKDFWLSSGSAHFWHFGQKTPATEWERRIDDLIAKHESTLDRAERKRIFDEVQRIFAENLPVLHFVAPRLYYAESSRVRGSTPSVLRPPVLWNADTISVAAARPLTN
jgi:peptide/nickel transport system substrate-binding protein